jgi:hypothetical protein
MNKDTFLQIVQSYIGIHPEDKVVRTWAAPAFGLSFLRPGIIVTYWPANFTPFCIWSIYTNTDNLSIAAHFGGSYQEAFQKAGFEVLQDSDAVLALAASNRNELIKLANELVHQAELEQSLLDMDEWD